MKDEGIFGLLTELARTIEQIRTKVLDPIYDGGPERLVVEFVPPGAPLPAVFVVLDRGDEYRLALCIAEVAKQRLLDVHRFVHALALELRR